MGTIRWLIRQMSRYFSAPTRQLRRVVQCASDGELPSPCTWFASGSLRSWRDGIDPRQRAHWAHAAPIAAATGRCDRLGRRRIVAAQRMRGGPAGADRDRDAGTRRRRRQHRFDQPASADDRAAGERVLPERGQCGPAGVHRQPRRPRSAGFGHQPGRQVDLAVHERGGGILHPTDADPYSHPDHLDPVRDRERDRVGHREEHRERHVL